jgi:ferredoxin
MTYVIAQPCIGQKNTSCVDVCPVDCIHPAPGEPGFDQAEMLYIDPEECIDCGVCAEACPEEAVFSDSDLPGKWAHFAQVNAGWYR